MGGSDHDQKLDALLHAAAQVFAERGFHRTSMRDLARASGVSLAGLYYYVQSKDELLFLIQDRAFATVDASMREAIADTSDPIDQLTRFVQNHVGFFATHMPEMKVLSHEAEALSGEYLASVNAKKRAYTLVLMDILTALEAKHGPAHTNRRAATYLLFGMMNWIYTWYDPLGDVDVSLLAMQITRIFLSGFIGLEVADPSSLSRGTAG